MLLEILVNHIWNKIFRVSIKNFILFITLASFTSYAAPIPQERGRLLPSLNGTIMQEGFSIKWISGHPQYFSSLASQIFHFPQITDNELYLVGHKISFSSTGLNKNYFLRQQSIIKDLYSIKINPMFKKVDNLLFSFDNHSFSTRIGQITKYSESSNVLHSSAFWKLYNAYGITIKLMKTSISFHTTAFMTELISL